MERAADPTLRDSPDTLLLGSRLWSFAQAEGALQELSAAAGLAPRGKSIPPSLADGPANEAALGVLLHGAAERLEVEAPGVSIRGRELKEVIRRAAPAILYIPERGLLALFSCGVRSATLLGPDLRRESVSYSQLHRALFAIAAQPHRPTVRSWLERMQVEPRAQKRSEERLLSGRLSDRVIFNGWLLRESPARPLLAQAHRLGLPGCVARIVAAYGLDYLCSMAALLLIGQGALSGRLDAGWLSGSLLLLFLVAALRLFGAAQEERLAWLGGALLHERLLLGALRSDSSELRRDGVGRLLGRILESESLEWLLAGGGLGFLMSVMELLLAGALLLFTPAPGGLPVLLLLLLSCALVAALGVIYARRHGTWAASRLELSAETIESMVGHRTRLSQLPPREWHEGEDAALSSYHAESQALDRVAVVLFAGVPRGFFLLAFVGLLPTLLTTRTMTPESALLLWAVLLCTQAFAQLGTGITRLAASRVAFHQTRSLLAAAATAPAPPAAATHLLRSANAVSPRAPLLAARDLSYTPPGRRLPVLNGLRLQIHAGDRLLLEGPSGAGKSSLGVVLAALRTPESGLLLLHGLDLASLGARAWRRRVALAPQFHDNHVMAASFAFNLLLGRAWPPRAADLQEARTVCEELGMGPLLARMPGGLFQQMGETGWRLSQGERSRVYLARAILQGAEIVILDESLGALDPQTLTQVADCLLRRVPTLMLIAHP